VEGGDVEGGDVEGGDVAVDEEGGDVAVDQEGGDVAVDQEGGDVAGDLVDYDDDDDDDDDFGIPLNVIEDAIFAEMQEEVGAGKGQKPPLLTGDYECIPPVLHGKLGTVLAMLVQLFEFNKNRTEKYPPEIIAAQSALVNAESNLACILEDIAKTDANEQAKMELYTNLVKKMKPMKAFLKKYHGYKQPQTKTKHLAKFESTEAEMKEHWDVVCEHDDTVTPENAEQHVTKWLKVYKSDRSINGLFSGMKKEARALVALKKQTLATMLKNWQGKPIENGIDAILAKYGISRQAFHSHSLIGPHCHLLLVNNEAILDEVEALLKDPTKRRHIEACDVEQLDDDIATFISETKSVMAALDYIFMVASKVTGKATDADCENFQDCCEYVGYIWRLYFPGSTVTHKLCWRVTFQRHCGSGEFSESFWKIQLSGYTKLIMITTDYFIASSASKQKNWVKPGEWQ
jgi:hypothetical protein